MTEALDALISRGQQTLDSLHGASEDLAALEVVVTSPDGLVTATADSHGSVVDLRIADDLSRESATRVQSSIVETTAAAAREALARRDEILRRMQSSLSET